MASFMKNPLVGTYLKRSVTVGPEICRTKLHEPALYLYIYLDQFLVDFFAFLFLSL